MDNGQLDGVHNNFEDAVIIGVRLFGNGNFSCKKNRRKTHSTRCHQNVRFLRLRSVNSCRLFESPSKIIELIFLAANLVK